MHSSVELRRPEDDLVFELPRDGRDGFLVPWQRERDRPGGVWNFCSGCISKGTARARNMKPSWGDGGNGETPFTEIGSWAVVDRFVPFKYKYQRRWPAVDPLLICCWDSDGWWLTPRWLPVLLELLGRRWSRRNEIPGGWWQLFSMNLLRTRSKVRRQQKLLSLESLRKIGSQSYFIHLHTLCCALSWPCHCGWFEFSVSRRTRIFVRMPCGEILPADLDLDWTTTQASEYIIATWHRLESLAAKFRGKGILPVIAAFLFITFSTSEKIQLLFLRAFWHADLSSLHQHAVRPIAEMWVWKVWRIKEQSMIFATCIDLVAFALHYTSSGNAQEYSQLKHAQTRSKNVNQTAQIDANWS